MKLGGYKTCILTFLAACVLGDCLCTYVAHRSPLAGRLYHLYQEDSDEIPIFGSSKAADGYNPEAMGLNCFNYGIRGAGYEVTDMMLQIELAKHKTSPIIIDMLPGRFKAIGDPNNYTPYLTHAEVRRLLRQSGKMRWHYYVPGLRYFGDYEWYLSQFIASRVRMGERYIRGYVFYLSQEPFDQRKFDELARLRLTNPVGYFPDEEEDHKLLAHIVEHPERLFFLVYSPGHASCFARFENANQFKVFKDKLKTYPNVVLIDAQRLPYPDDYFGDTVHLSQKGALDFSTRLGVEIREALRTHNGTRAVPSPEFSAGAVPTR
jgi:hypothetical protein